MFFPVTVMTIQPARESTSSTARGPARAVPGPMMFTVVLDSDLQMWPRGIESISATQDFVLQNKTHGSLRRRGINRTRVSHGDSDIGSTRDPVP